MALELESVPGFRDLGGLRTADGATLRHGRLFRSQALSSLSKADLGRIRALDIGLVCDLRSLGERLDSPNTCFDQGRTMTLVSGSGARLSAVRAIDWQRYLADSSFDQERATRMMISAYRSMPAALIEALVGLFEHCEQSDERPLLIHCTAGKDRTGFVVAMLLWALGVSYESILDNYLSSGEMFFRTGHVQQQLANLFPEGAPLRAEGAARAISCVQPAYLEAALAEITREYVSVASYLREAVGLTEARQEKLRHRFLHRPGVVTRRPL